MASDNNKDEKLPLISDGFSPNFKKDVPKKVLQLLNTAHFNEDELKAAEILKKELVALLSKSYYGQFLSLLSLGDLIENICLWPLIRESAIRDAQNSTSLMTNQPKNGNLSIQTKQEVEIDEPLDQSVDHDSSSKSSQNISSTLLQDDNPILVNTKHFSSNNHIRPRGKSLLLRDPAVLRKVYAMNGAFEGAGFIADGVWKLLLLTILGYDVYQYSTNSVYHNITPVRDIILGTSRYGQSLSVILMNPRVWPVVLGLPIVWGIGNGVLQAWQMRRWDKDKVDDFVQAFHSYRSHFYRDLLAWLPNTLTFGLLPASQMKRQIEIAEKALLWDGRIDANKHKALFLALEECLLHAKKFTLLQLINTFAHLAEGVSERDYPKLAKAGISKEMLTTLLYVKTQAFHRLRQTAKGKIKYKEQLKSVGSLLSLYAHYHLWRLGQPQSKLLQPVFWIGQLISYYLYIYFGARIVQNVVDFVNNYIAETNCLYAGKQWLYMKQTANYTCSVCGDWPIFYKDIYDDVTCWNAYLQEPRTPEEILTAINRINFEHISTINFSNQNFTEPELSNILLNLQKKISVLQTAYLNMTIGYNLEISQLGSEIIAEFMLTTQVKQLYLDGFIFPKEATYAISNNLNKSMVQTLSFANCVIYDEYTCAEGGKGVTVDLMELTKGLANSYVEELILDMNSFNDTDIISLAHALPASNIKNLSLSATIISDAALSVLVEILPKCKNLMNLVFDYCSTDAELIALGHILNQTSAINHIIIDLELLTNAGLMALADSLPDSYVRSLTLFNPQENLNITQNAIDVFGKSIANSPIEELNLGVIDSQIFISLALELENSNIQSLNLGFSVDDFFLTAVGNILPATMISTLSIATDEATDYGLNVFGTGLKKSVVKNFSLNLFLNMNITACGITSILGNLPTNSIQSFELIFNGPSNTYLDISQAINAFADLGPYSQLKYFSINGWNHPFCIMPPLHTDYLVGISAQSLIRLANSLRGSSMESLSLLMETNGETGIIALAQALPYTKISSLTLAWINGTDAMTSLAKVIPHSFLQTLYLEVIATSMDGIQFLAKALPGSSLQTLVLGVGASNINAQSDIVAQLIAEQLSTAPLSGKDLAELLNLETQIALAKANPNTNLTYLALNNITTIGAKTLCRVIPQTNIQMPLSIVGKIDPSQVNINTCIISSASSNSPLWIFKTMYLSYQIGEEYLKWTYETIINQTLEFSEPKKITENTFEEINEDDDEFDTFETEEPFHFDAIYNNDVWSNSMPSFSALSSSPHQGFVMNYQGWQFSNNNAQYPNFSSTNSIVPASVDPVNGIIAVYMVYKITAPVIKSTFNGVKNLVGSAINFFSSKEELPVSQLDTPKKSSQSWFSFFTHRSENHNSTSAQNNLENTAKVAL